MLEIKVFEEKIETTNNKDYLRGTVGAQVKITFDVFWSNYEKTVVFERCYDALSEPVNVLVAGMDVTLEIPPEILVESGKYKIGVFGEKNGTVLPTLYSEEFNSLYATDTKGGKDPEIYTPSELDQLREIKQDKLTPGDGIKIDENNVISASGGGGGTTDYTELDNKPKINGVELIGDKTIKEYGAVPMIRVANPSVYTQVGGGEKEVELIEIDNPGNIDDTNDGYGRGNIPRRNNNGRLTSFTPTTEYEVANKKYVDSLVGDIESLLGGI